MHSFFLRLPRYFCYLILCVLSGCTPQTLPPSSIQFVDVAFSAGIVHSYTTPSANGLAVTILETIGHGAAFLDYDHDGNLDILLVDTKPKLYRGDGKGQFTETTQAAGFDKLSGHFLGCAVGDTDNNGYPEIYLSGYGTGLLLHNEGGKRFRDITQSAGLKPQPWGSSCGFVDLDSDGLLDLVVCNYVKFGFDPQKYPQRCEPLACTPQMYDAEKPTLYHNLGGGKFRDITQSSGMNTAAGKALGVAFADYDNDGDQDILIANDQLPGDLFENQGKMQFVNRGDVSGTALGPDGRVHGGMGADWADYNRDGLLDAVVTTYTDQTKSLYHNDGQGIFRDLSERNGISTATLPYLAFGVKWLDYDNDGYTDLMIANGNVDNKIAMMFPEVSYRQPTQLLKNLGNGQFADASKSAGKALQKPIVGRGLAAGDYDNDGRIDVLLTENEGAIMLLHNEGKSEGLWIGFTLQGKGKSNRDALGSRVTITTQAGTQIQEVQTASSYLSASDKRLIFGLGAETSLSKITVRWADGRTETYPNLAIDRYHTLVEGIDSKL
jgi:enediyne biosynthesis protein E4